MADALEQVVNTAKQGAEQVAQLFRNPNDDWMPVFVAINDVGKVTVGTLDLRNEMAKNLMATKVIPDYIRSNRISAIALVLSAWAAEVRQGDSMKVPVRRMPDRKEVLEISGMDAQATRLIFNDIKRHPSSPPELTGWNELEDVGTVEGRFVTDISRALKEVAKN